MRLSTRSTYGMRALVELAFASGRGPLSASAIARRQSLSVAYLDQLLHRLKKQGVVRSIRGPKGGYILAKEPRAIHMASIVSILEGTMATTNGKGKGQRLPVRVSTPRPGERIGQAVVRTVQERLTRALESLTLADLCEEVRTQDLESEHRYVFHI